MRKKIVILLADGFEEIEALSTCDFLRRVGLDVDLVRVGEGSTALGAHNMKIVCDKLLSEVDYDDMVAVILPGGMPGSINLRDNENVIDLVQKSSNANKLVAAICAAPMVLERAGLLGDSGEFSAYPGMDEFYGNKAPSSDVVKVAGNIITGRGPGATIPFAVTIAKALGEDESVAKVMDGMLWA